MTKNIVLIGGYGGHDIGDESMLTTDLINLKRFIPDAEFLALSPNPEYTSTFHKVDSDWDITHYLSGFSVTQKEIEPPRIAQDTYELQFQAQQNIFWRILKFAFKSSIKYPKIFGVLFNAWIFKKINRTIFLNDEGKRLLNNLKNADLLFNVGGGNIKGGFCDRFIIYSTCRIFGKPAIVSGQTIGPFDRWIGKKIAGFFLNKVDVITLRDTMSINVLEDLKVRKPIVKETADDAVLLPATDQEKIKTILLSEKIGDCHPLIGINTNAYLKSVLQNKNYELNKIKQVLAAVADRLISELGARIVFIPMDYNADSDDRVSAYEVLELMKNRNNASVIIEGYDDQTLKGIIGQLDAGIGLRYHFVVFATTMQVPTIGIYLGEYYKMKIGGILELMGQEKYALDFEKTSAEEIVELVKDALQNKDEIKKKLEERTKILGERSLFTIEYAARKLLTTETQVK
jgi:polysaccharide pyruvyl transferase WcaK-like protein